MNKRPRLFIGSSSEGKDVARAIELGLKNDAEIMLWDNPAAFRMSHGIMESLVDNLGTYDFSVLVLTPDDILQSRGSESLSPRDNVLFELGLSMGTLGRERTFIVLDPSRVGIPSDLQGVVVAPYSLDRDDKNVNAALSTTCTIIRDAMRMAQASQAAISPRSWRRPEASGLTGYYASYPIHEMMHALSQARDEIIILQTWISGDNELFEAFKEALNRAETAANGKNFRIRIILIDPDSPFCELRGIHSGHPPGDAKKRAEDFQEYIAKFKQKWNVGGPRMEIRLSDEMPTFAIFGADDTIYFNPYLRQRNTYQSPCFRFHARENSFVKELREHFDALWARLGART